MGTCSRRAGSWWTATPERPAGISATEAEHAAALLLAQTVRRFLQEAGWPDPVLADSGNGGHLVYRIDLPNDAASTALVKRCLDGARLPIQRRRRPRGPEPRSMPRASGSSTGRSPRKAMRRPTARIGSPGSWTCRTRSRSVSRANSSSSRRWPRPRRMPRRRESAATSTSSAGSPTTPTSSTSSPRARGRAAGNGCSIPAPGTRRTRTARRTSSSSRAGPSRRGASTTAVRGRTGTRSAISSSPAGARDLVRGMAALGVAVVHPGCAESLAGRHARPGLPPRSRSSGRFPRAAPARPRLDHGMVFASGDRQDAPRPCPRGQASARRAAGSCSSTATIPVARSSGDSAPGASRIVPPSRCSPAMTPPLSRTARRGRAFRSPTTTSSSSTHWTPRAKASASKIAPSRPRRSPRSSTWPMLRPVPRFSRSATRPSRASMAGDRGSSRIGPT